MARSESTPYLTNFTPVVFFGGFFLEGLHQCGYLLAGLVYLGIAHFAIAGDDFGEAEQLDTVIVGIGLI